MGRNRDMVKRSAQGAIRQPKKSKNLETGDTETANNNNEINITNVNDDLSSDAETIIYEEPIIKHRTSKRTGDPMQHLDTKKIMKNVDDSYDVQFIKQVPMHPRNSLARVTKNAQRDDDNIDFIKQAPMHPRDR